VKIAGMSASGADGGLRVLVLSADVGEGHLAAARAVARGLRASGTVTVMERDGLEVFGTRWGRDWRACATAATIAADATTGLRGGDVILLHDADHYSAHGSWQRTVRALPFILDRAGEAGLTFV
jgi:hypothetical protein